MQRHRDEKRLTILSSGLQALSNALIRWMNGVGVVRAVHRWRSESSISLSEIEISFKEVMLLRRIKQSEAYGLIRRALVSMRSDGKRACLMNWKYGCKLVVWCVDWEARAVERAAAADAALAKAMVKALTLAPTLTLTLALSRRIQRDTSLSVNTVRS